MEVHDETPVNMDALESDDRSHLSTAISTGNVGNDLEALDKTFINIDEPVLESYDRSQLSAAISVPMKMKPAT